MNPYWRIIVRIDGACMSVQVLPKRGGKKHSFDCLHGLLAGVTDAPFWIGQELNERAQYDWTVDEFVHATYMAVHALTCQVRRQAAPQGLAAWLPTPGNDIVFGTKRDVHNIGWGVLRVAPVKCECGAASVGTTHSTWCPCFTK
jgi:hypothetical protein